MLLNKRSELTHILTLEHPDIVLISEVLPKNFNFAIQRVEVEMNGYMCFSNCFDSDISGRRGIIIYVKAELGAQEISMTSEQKAAIESVWIEINLKDKEKLLAGCVYRSPSSTFENTKMLYQTVLDLTKDKAYVLVTGDFNQPDVDWVNETALGNKATAFMEFFRDSFLHQHVKSPTHYRGDQNPTLIDLVMSSEENMVTNLTHEAPIGKSHHHVLKFDFVCSTTASNINKGQRYNYRMADFDKLRKCVENSKLMNKIQDKNLTEVWNSIKETIETATEECVPKISSRPLVGKRKTPVWWSETTKTKICKKREAYRKYLQTLDNGDYLRYAKARNQAKTACRKAIQDHEKSIARDAKRNPKAFFAYAKSKMKVKEGLADLKDSDGNTISSDKEKANLLNAFFCSVFTNERMQDIPNCTKPKVNSSLKDITFTYEMVLEKLKNLDPSKSPGPDGLHPCILKELAKQLAEPVAFLFNKSLSEGKLPNIWKDANVTPLFKKGEKYKTSNYRPVSLTCVLCKVMESLIRDRLVDYLIEQELLSEFQHGFIAKRSCTTNLLVALDAWTKYLDTNVPVDAVYLDFAKAFDSVPHQRLIRKLESYGVNSQLLAWISDFLLGRRQRVKVNGCFSEWAPVSSGVPQGSCLGPVLFVVFINDLPDVVSSMCQMYADDTKVFSRADSDDFTAQLQRDLDNLVNWADKWQLRFNADKCHILHLGHNNPHHEYRMRKHDTDETVLLQVVEEEKDLGVLVDQDLKFSKHVESQVNKANKILGLIRRSFTHLDKDSMRRLFTALVRPHLEFSNVVWAPRFQKDKVLIENVLRRATKIIPGFRNLNYEQRLRKIGLPSMQYRRDRGDMIEAYKYTHDMYFANKELLHLDSSSTTRGHKLKLCKERCSHNLRQNFFSIRVVNKWNQLPEDVVDAPSLLTFKCRLDAFYEAYKYCVQ